MISKEINLIPNPPRLYIKNEDPPFLYESWNNFTAANAFIRLIIPAKIAENRNFDVIVFVKYRIAMIMKTLKYK